MGFGQIMALGTLSNKHLRPPRLYSFLPFFPPVLPPSSVPHIPLCGHWVQQQH